MDEAFWGRARLERSRNDERLASRVVRRSKSARRVGARLRGPVQLVRDPLYEARGDGANGREHGLIGLDGSAERGVRALHRATASGAKRASAMAFAFTASRL